MALIEKYISPAGSGAHDGSSAGNAWTFAEATAVSGLVAGDRGNVIEGAYLSGAVSIVNSGNSQSPLVLRGYSSVIGDLVGDRTVGNGEIDATDYPVITLTGILTPNTFVFFEAMSFTGALSSALVGSASVDNWHMMHCIVINTQNNGAAQAVLGDDDCQFVNCDFECSGAAHGVVVDIDYESVISYCRIKGVANTCLKVNNAVVRNSLFWGSSSHVGIHSVLVNTSHLFRASSNTFSGLDKAFYFAQTSQIVDLMVIDNCFASDCSEWIDCAYVGTANQPITEMNNWLYNVTTERTGVSDMPISRQIGPTSGAAGVYFEDAAGGDFNLVSSAPGRGFGMWPDSDVGAFQAVRAGGLAAAPRHGSLSGGFQ